MLTQGASVPCAALVVVLASDSVDQTGILLALAGGGASALSMTSFFMAMQLGLVSIASPLLASGSVLAFGLSVATGDRPGTSSLIGAGLVFGGVAMISFQEWEGEGHRWKAVGFGALAALGLGFSLYLLGRASAATGTPLAVFVARTSAFLIVAAFAVRMRPSLRVGWSWFAVVMGATVASVGAVTLFALSSEIGLISIAAVLSSLYPLVTVLLAYLFLDERLRPPQLVGLGLALGGISLVTLSY